MLKIRAKCKSANMGSSTVKLRGVHLIDIQVKLIIKTQFYIIKNAGNYIVSVETL